MFTIGQIIGLLLTVVACQVNAIWLSGISVLVPFFVPGLWTFAKFLLNGKSLKRSQVAEAIKIDKVETRSLLLIVLFAETLVYAIDGALVLKYAGHDEAAVFAVTVRISAVFAIVPMIVAPLSSSLNLRSGEGLSSRNVNFLQRSVGLTLWVVIMLIGGPAFNFLSHGELQFDFWTMAAACTSGLILAFTTTEIQRATSLKMVKTKSILTSIVAFFNIVFTISVCPWIGATAAFVSTGIGQLIYYVVIRLCRKREA
jgi:hypothetical protein